MGIQRFSCFVEKHVGVGLRWNTNFYALSISIALPFVTFEIGIGKEKYKEPYASCGMASGEEQ